ncbi:MAG: hypothetical protein COV72_02720 [Candidatus Omnitrophica bacterium CG11_big_fil_rev_8_21_14_0_20_42_13]|uniref:Secondary thiamine-phosphate synthase enzyme n=1 Tax=Candidatus Ghiorseimicrobium undicola TaxID=1974746 RepID=A0A2H0M0V5_9BACT|nr:MAG: hypothetical protein COV72_02720 [Candidatus Omnitrophica bacterium CG11_big_fil_rev_8_21_14_0_20_42_13]
MFSFSVSTAKKEELIDITPKIEKIISDSRVNNGICVIFIPHTTCGITINENADPSVINDIIKGLMIIPETGFKHAEGNSPAHIKTTLTGSSINLIIEEGKPLLGTWQGIYLAEYDGPRKRQVWVKTIGSQP